MTEVEKLLALEDIKTLKARYFRCADTKDWNGFAAVFAPDAAFDISEDVPDCILVGREKILGAVRPALQGCVSVHHGHCPEISVTSATTAEGVWAMEGMLRWKDRPASRVAALHGYGHYRETYRKIDGAWLIQSLKLSRLRVDVTRWGDAP